MNSLRRENSLSERGIDRCRSTTSEPSSIVEVESACLFIPRHLHGVAHSLIQGRRKLLGREDLVYVEDNDEMVVLFTHAFDELRLQLGAYLRCRLYLLRLQFEYLLD